MKTIMVDMDNVIRMEILRKNGFKYGIRLRIVYVSLNEFLIIESFGN